MHTLTQPTTPTANGVDALASSFATSYAGVVAFQAALDRMTQAGIIPSPRTWSLPRYSAPGLGPDATKYAELYGEFAPHYRAAIESHQRAQEAARPWMTLFDARVVIWKVEVHDV